MGDRAKWENLREIAGTAQRGTEAAWETTVSSDEVQIRDLEGKPIPEWLPPSNAMGGPPASDFYRDLVLHSGMQLFRGNDGEPWLALQDGEHRRVFRIPSSELVSALDRFRMRRNQRPLPEKDLDEFTRIVEARVSDPDARLPTFDPARPEPDRVERPPGFMRGLLEGQGLLRPITDDRGILPGDGRPTPNSISGGLLREQADDPTTERYARQLRELVRFGGWLGAIGDLSKWLGDDPEVAFENLLRYQGDLARLGIMVGQVEVEGQWRWLAVDRSWFHGPRFGEPVDAQAASP